MIDLARSIETTRQDFYAARQANNKRGTLLVHAMLTQLTPVGYHGGHVIALVSKPFLFASIHKRLDLILAEVQKVNPLIKSIALIDGKPDMSECPSKRLLSAGRK